MTYRLIKRAAAIRSKTYPDARLVDSPRLLWYNKLLDPALNRPPVDTELRRNEGNPTFDRGGLLDPPTDKHPANLVSSLCEDGLHRPALDIDIPFAEFGDYAYSLAAILADHVIATESAGGNTHVYCPRAYLWESYRLMLHTLVEDDWLEESYVAHSTGRGQTLLRLPGVPKLWFNEGHFPPRPWRPSLEDLFDEF